MLDVLYGPEVTVPEKKEVEDGEDVMIECVVSANPRPTSIIWTKEDDPEFKQIGSQLKLSGSDPAAVNNGRYTCSATNTIHPTGRQRKEMMGNATITVAVKHAPGKTRISPDSPTAYEGKPITLECGAKPPGYPLPTYRWWKEGSESSVLATGAQFTIDSASLASAGKYFCQPNNQFGSGSVAETSLNVYQEPKIVTSLQPTVIKRAGDTGYHVSCSAVAKPRPSVTWFKDGVPIDDSTSDLYQISVTAQETISNEAFNVLSTLKFVGPERIGKDQLMPTDRGHYSCQFENEVAKTESAMLLKIEHSPVVRHLHNKVAADFGETAFISCKMQAYPSLKFDWSKSNSLLNDRSMYRTNMTELKDDIYEGILKIERVEESTYGEYICKAQNAMGAQRTIIKLQPKGKPEQPVNVRAVSKGYDTIALAWDEGFNGGYDKTTYNVEYKELSGGSLSHAICAKPACNITGLSQHTSYLFKVRAANIRGDSEWSRDVKITTNVDVNRIPVPENLFYETSNQQVSFSVINYPLSLVAKIELQNSDGSYRAHAQLGMDDNLPYGQMKISEPVSGLRIKLCITEEDEVCGPYAEAGIVKVREFSLFSAGANISQGGVIAICIIAGIIALAAFVIFIKCCVCKEQPKAKKLTKDDIAGPATNHTTFNYGMDNKGVDTAKDADSPDIIKSQMYGYNYHPSVPGAQVANPYDQQSSSNSNNGGSVNSQVNINTNLMNPISKLFYLPPSTAHYPSWYLDRAQYCYQIVISDLVTNFVRVQDSLWNVKHPNGEVIGANGYITAGYYGEPAQYPGQYQHGQPQQPHPGHPQQQQLQYDDYTHYPHPDEYLNERNRAYFNAHNGDRYAVPAKPRHRLESDCKYTSNQNRF